MNKVILPRLYVDDGTLEALKWVALLLMSCDHIDKYLFNGTKEFLFDAGRVAMPLFVFVLAYNLARPGALERGAYPRTMARLAGFGVLATPAFMALGGLMAGWWPLNILFALFVLTAVLALIERRTLGSYVAAAAVFLIGGSCVEFWWPALTFGLAVWWYCKQPGTMPMALALTALAALWFINSNQWALLALPAILGASLVNLHVPRLRWIFYTYYPLHLAAIWLIRKLEIV